MFKIKEHVKNLRKPKASYENQDRLNAWAHGGGSICTRFVSSRRDQVKQYAGSGGA